MHGYKWPINCTRTRTDSVAGRRKKLIDAGRVAHVDTGSLAWSLLRQYGGLPTVAQICADLGPTDGLFRDGGLLATSQMSLTRADNRCVSI